MEKLLEEETDFEETFIYLIGDIEYDMAQRIKALIHKKLESRIDQLNETAFGEKIDALQKQIDHLPPYIKHKIENLIIALLQKSEHLPESIKQKIKEYTEEQKQHEPTSWQTVSDLGSSALAPFMSFYSYITNFAGLK